jgi:hypothetical protein
MSASIARVGAVIRKAVAWLFDRERLITGARPTRGIPAPAAPQDIRSSGQVTAQRKGELNAADSESDARSVH